jgi:hypothetical protein
MRVQALVALGCIHEARPVVEALGDYAGSYPGRTRNPSRSPASRRRSSSDTSV